MNSNSKITVPENLFHAIHKIHKEATELYEKIPQENKNKTTYIKEKNTVKKTKLT